MKIKSKSKKPDKMLVRVFDSTGKLVREIHDVPDNPDLILTLVGRAMRLSDNPNQDFHVRVENQNQFGYWMTLEKPLPPH